MQRSDHIFAYLRDFVETTSYMRAIYVFPVRNPHGPARAPQSTDPASKLSIDLISSSDPTF